MKWPWVSRLAYEAVVREGDELRAFRDRQHNETELLHQEIKRLHGEAEKLVSRLAYETVVGERDQLREQVGEMVQHIVRMDRVEHGKAENPREPRPPIEDMPQKLREHIKGFASTSIQKTMFDEASRRHAKQGVPWSRIIEETIAEEDSE